MPVLESIQLLIQMSPGIASVVKWLQREAVHSPPCSAKSRNERRYISSRLGLTRNKDMFSFLQRPVWAEIAQSVQRLATGWTVRGSNPGGSEIFRTRSDRPWGPPSLLYIGYRVFSGVKAAGAWRWPPTPPSAEVKGRVYTSTPPLGLRGLFWGEP